MTKKQSLLSLLLAMCLCMALAIPALAADEVITNNAVNPFDNNLSVEPRSTSLPTDEWFFSDSGDYTGKFFGLRHSTMYTNYYFTSVFASRFRCQSEAPNQSFVPGIYCMNCRKDVVVGSTMYTPAQPMQWSSWSYNDNYREAEHRGHRCVPYVKNTSNDAIGSMISINGEVIVTTDLGR